MTSRHRCWRSWGGSHASTLTPCDYCEQPAVFHWRNTYPDVMLCGACLEDYPEAKHGPQLAYLTLDKHGGWPLCLHRRTQFGWGDEVRCLDCGSTLAVADG